MKIPGTAFMVSVLMCVDLGLL